MALWQIRWSSAGRATLFPSEVARRKSVRALARVGGSGLILFCIVDDHIHVVLQAEEKPITRARGLWLALRNESCVALGDCWMETVQGRSHLVNIVRYYMQQSCHHGIAVHPALWTGSCFQDLVGARRLPGFGCGLLEYLPRLSPAELNSAAGLGDCRLAPATNESIREAGAFRLASTAAEALAVGPELNGRKADVVAARASVCHLAEEARIARQDVVEALGIPLRTCQRLVHFPVPDKLLTTVRLRMTLEDVVARSVMPRRDSEERVSSAHPQGAPLASSGSLESGAQPRT
jgi:hypothetical protein